MDVLMANPKRTAGKTVKKSFIRLCCAREIKNIRLIIQKTIPRAATARERGAILEICNANLKTATPINTMRKRCCFESFLKRNPAKNTSKKVIRA